MKIALIHPYITVREVDSYMSEPLGLLCLATYLEEVFDDVEVTIVDLYAERALDPKPVADFWCLGESDPAAIQARIAALEPDLVGIHCNFTAYSQDSLDVARIVREGAKDLPIVIGGAHPTIEGDSILRDCPSIDYVVRGEGELVLANLVRHLKGEIPVEEVKGLTYRSTSDNIVGGVQILNNEAQPLIKDLDDLPIPSRKFIDMEKYEFFNRNTIWYVKKKPVATIMTTRGCPYDCVFCSTKVVWQRNWRFRSLENVFAEIRYLYDEFGVREFVINDDQFMTRKKRIHAFCDYVIENKLDITFSVDSGISIWLVDVETLAKMKEAGFYSLRFPIETGSKKTLKYVNKPVDLDKAKVMIDEANKLGFWTSSNIIVGFPDETKEDIEESIGYVFDSSLDFTSFIIAKPNAGADMYEDFRSAGLLEKTVVQGSDFYHSDYDTLHLTAGELNDIVQDASGRWFTHKMKFYLHPKNFYNYFLPKIRSLEDLRYFFQVAIVIFQRKLLPMIRRSLAGSSA